MANVGRPKLTDTMGIDFNNEEQQKELIKYIELSLTAKEIAYVYGISAETLRRIIKEQLNTNFDNLQKKHALALKTRARRNLIKLSDEGDTSATIFLNKITGAVEEDKRQGLEIKKKKLDHDIWRDTKMVELKERELEKGTDVNVTFTEEEFFKAFNEVDTSDDLLDGNEVANYQGFDLDE